MKWFLLTAHAQPEDLGFIPDFLSEADPRSAKEQIHANYQHGGGWRSFPGFVLNKKKFITYPGDPPQHPFAMTALRDETILVYPASWVLILQQDGTYDAARLD